MNIIATTEADFRPAIENEDATFVLFGAAWCAPCKVMKARLDAIAAKMPDVTFRYVDADTDRQVFADYGVRAVPTYMVFRRGELKARGQNPTTTPAMVEWIEKGLAL